MIGPDDERHGTTRGYAQGCRCTPCREGRNTYERTRKKRKTILGIHNAIDATGTRRRIHALMALGHTSRAIAHQCGWTSGEAVLEITRRNWVQRKTAITVRRVYDQMSMTTGPSSSARIRAHKKGWVPPLAWDNIDTDLAPHGHRTRHSDRDYDSAHIIDEATILRILAGETLPANKAERLETMRRWLALGNSERSLCERMGWKDGRYVTRGAA